MPKQNPKSGRQRKAKRKARQKLDQEIQQKHELWDPVNEQEARQNNALIRQSLRWNTDWTKDTEDVREMTAKEVALMVTRRNMLSWDPSVANSAVRNLISMEGQNQADQTKKNQPDQHLHLHAAADAVMMSDEELLKGLQMLEDLRSGNQPTIEPGGAAVESSVPEESGA